VGTGAMGTGTMGNKEFNRHTYITLAVSRQFLVVYTAIISS